MRKTTMEAQIIDSTFYYDGKPCPRGHYSKRYRSTGGCLECHIKHYEPNKKPKARKSKFYVYIVKVDGEVKYIGEGHGKRTEHATSGVSHNYQLNKAHFEGRNVEVKILKKRYRSKEEAVAHELKLINYFHDRGFELYNIRGVRKEDAPDWGITQAKATREKLKAKAKEMSEQGMSTRAIGRELDKSNATISRWLK